MKYPAWYGIIGGIAALESIPWGKSLLLVGLGMAAYSGIVSPGYFAGQGQWAMVGMFAVLFIGAVFAVLSLLMRPATKGRPS